MSLSCQLEPDLKAEEFQSILLRSGLSERRPANDLDRLDKMCRNAQIILTCRSEDETLVGVSRAVTDYSYCTYLSDLAVDKECQGKGVGKELIKQTHEQAGKNTALILLSAPSASSYYPHVGMERHESCWIVGKES